MTVPAPPSAQPWGVVAYGGLSASTRFAALADSAPDLAARVGLAALAGTQADRFADAREHLSGHGLDPVEAMGPAAPAVDGVWRAVAGEGWDATVVLAHLACGLVVDLGDDAAGQDAAGQDTGREDDDAGAAPPEVVAEAARRAGADARAHDRLALAARRLLGEALAAAAVLDPGGTGRAGRAGRQRLKSRHGRRAGALGL